MKKTTRIRNSRPLERTPPPPLELLHPAFSSFYQARESSRKPYRLPPDLDVAIFSAQMLLRRMPLLLDSHDERLHLFLDSLLPIFPQDGTYEWVINESPQGGDRSKVDLTYRLIDPEKFPAIYVEIKLELGTGGDPNIQAQEYYRRYLQSQSRPQSTGAPIFLISLSGE